MASSSPKSQIYKMISGQKTHKNENYATRIWHQMDMMSKFTIEG